MDGGGWRRVEEGGGGWRRVEESGGEWRMEEDGGGWRRMEEGGGGWRRVEDGGGGRSEIKLPQTKSVLRVTISHASIKRVVFEKLDCEHETDQNQEIRTWKMFKTGNDNMKDSGRYVCVCVCVCVCVQGITSLSLENGQNLSEHCNLSVRTNK